jgi:hypothetical protein
MRSYFSNQYLWAAENHTLRWLCGPVRLIVQPLGPSAMREAFPRSDHYGPSAMREAFPRSDYYGPSAPPHSHRLTTRQPDLPRLAEHDGTGTAGWFPRSLQTGRQVRRPAMPLRYRDGYAAGFHRGLRDERP